MADKIILIKGIKEDKTWTMEIPVWPGALAINVMECLQEKIKIMKQSGWTLVDLPELGYPVYCPDCLEISDVSNKTGLEKHCQECADRHKKIAINKSKLLKAYDVLSI